MKLTLKLLIEAVYDTESDGYPEGSTAIQMARSDLENDSGAFLEDAEITILDAKFKGVVK